MLSSEERKLLVDAHEKGYQTKDLAKIFKTNVNSVNRIIRQKKRTDSCELKTHNCGRKSILTETDFKHISELIITQPDITINEIKDRYIQDETNKCISGY